MYPLRRCGGRGPSPSRKFRKTSEALAKEAGPRPGPPASGDGSGKSEGGSRADGALRSAGSPFPRLSASPSPRFCASVPEPAVVNAVAPPGRGGVQSAVMNLRSARLAGGWVLAAAVHGPGAAQDPPAAPPSVRASSATSAEFLRKIRAVQQGLRTVRAKCEVFSAFTTIDRTIVQRGIVLWRRDPDGTVRQRWDLAQTDDEGKPAKPETILVVGGEILYLENGEVRERGPLRAEDVFHHPAFGGPVLTAPSDDAMKDPEMAFEIHPLGGESAGAATTTPARAPAEGEPGEAPPPPGSFYVVMRPRKAPWTGLLEDAKILIEPGRGTILGAVYTENNRNEYRIEFSGLEANPELDDSGADAPRGKRFVDKAIGNAMTELYNAAQLDVLRRAGEAVRSVPSDGGRK